MLSDLIAYLTTSCPQYLRHMDYLSEVIAMRKRYRRNRRAWQPHLDCTRRFVLSAAVRCQSRDKAVVLGAGLLLDVPLEELASLFREVVLLDIIFLHGALRIIKRFPNVRPVTHDVTTVARRLYDNVRSRVRELPEAVPSVPGIDAGASLVVSLNILSQLWVAPRAYALSKLPGLAGEEVDDWCRQIVESHYAFLRSAPCPACLVADFEFVKRDPGGSVISRGSTVAGLALPEPEDSWTWNIVPPGAKGQYVSKELKVGGWFVR